MILSGILSLGLLAGLATTAPAANYVQHEKRDMGLHHSRQWVKRSRAPAEAHVPVRIALAQRNLDKAHDMLIEISNPYSPSYGKHLTPHEIGDLVAPAPESIDNIRQWLHEAGVDLSRHLLTPGLGYLKFNATIAEVEDLLQTQYHVFEHAETGEEHVACDDYHLPGYLRPHIDFVHPTVNMRPIKRTTTKRNDATRQNPGALPPHLQPVKIPASLASDSGALSTCFDFVTIDCIRALYSIPHGNTSESGNELGILELQDFYDQEDLNRFFASFKSGVPQNTHPKLDSIDGGEAPAPDEEGGGESLLDFELSIPLIYPQSTVLYQVDAPDAFGDIGFGDIFLDALDASFCGGDNKTLDPTYPISGPGGYNHTEMCGRYKPTTVISVSYGIAEFNYNSVYVNRQCQEYMKLGLAGTSVLYASGDSGVSSRQGCITNGTMESFAPLFPSTCPYVTSVGATEIAFGKSPRDPHPEIAVNATSEFFWSGGGFSNFFGRPDYQTNAVQSYLDNHAPDYPAGTYNKSSRGYPDVSAVGLQIYVQSKGMAVLSGGTSASTPIFASIITLINEQRIAAGKGSVGFLNPTLYAHPEVFRDITIGSNPGCGTQGFPAAAGWDPVTGLGTPNTPALMELFMSLP